MPGFVVVRSYLNAFDAELAASALEAADIPAVIHRDDGGGVQPNLWLGGVDVLVREEDAPAAAAVLATAGQPPPGDGEPSG